MFINILREENVMSLFGNKKENDDAENTISDVCNVKYNDEDKIQIDYTENPPVHQLYDTTRLIIDSKEENPFRDNIYNCRVSYYGKDDVNISNNESDDFGRKGEYKKVIIGLDIDKINNGEKFYYKALMTALLDEDRVSKYLARGMQEEPDVKCGNYIGEVREDSDGIYKKFFDSKIGTYFHLKYASTRDRLISDDRIANQQKIDKIIAEKEAQIASLQREVEALKKEKENLYLDSNEEENEKVEDKLKDYYSNNSSF